MSDESERPNQERLAGWRDQAGTSRPEPLRPPSEEMDAVQLWSSLQDGKGLIFRIAAFGFLAVLLVTLVSTMQFRAHGSIYLGELDGGPTASEQNSEINLSNGERSDLTSETEILQSDLLVKRAILESGLNVSLAPSGWRKPPLRAVATRAAEPEATRRRRSVAGRRQREARGHVPEPSRVSRDVHHRHAVRALDTFELAREHRAPAFTGAARQRHPRRPREPPRHRADAQGGDERRAALRGFVRLHGHAPRGHRQPRCKVPHRRVREGARCRRGVGASSRSSISIRRHTPPRRSCSI